MRVRVLSTLLVAVVLAAVPAIALAFQHPNVTQQLLAHSHVIYVSGGDAVWIYPEDGGPGPIGRISRGIKGPHGLAVDAHGSLYVANTGAQNVLVFPPGASKPSLVITQGLHMPMSVGVSPATSQIYIGDIVGTIEIYAPTVGAPIGEIPAQQGTSGVSVPLDLAIDKAGDVFVYSYVNSLYSANEVLEYPGGSQPIKYLDDDSNGWGLDLDRNGSVVFASPGSYYLEKCVCVTPFLPSGRKGYFGVPGSPVAVRLNSTEDRAYVLDRHGNQELITYSYPGGKPLRKLRSVKGIDGIAVSPANPF